MIVAIAAGNIKRPRRLKEDLERPNKAAWVLPDFVDLKNESELAKPVKRKKKARDERPEIAIRRRGNWKSEGTINSLSVGDLRDGKRDSAKRWEVTMKRAASPRSPWKTRC